MTLDNMTGITKGSYTGGDMFCKSQLITCNRVKECNGVCPFEDALKHADKEMNKQTIIDHDREWIIGCIKHDGFIKTDRFDKANKIILEALEPTEPSDLTTTNTEKVQNCGDLISRAELIKRFKSFEETYLTLNTICDEVQSAPSVSVPQGDLISRSEAVKALLSHFVPQTYTGEDVEIAEKLAKKIMSKVPSVSAERVVRCKDCEYGDVLDEYESGSCSNSNGLIGYITKDDFCSYGVAKMKGEK